MLIAEFSKATGLSRDAIRFYVRKGLLHPALGSSDSNRYAVFDEAYVERALMIKLGQSLGFTLREMATLNEEFSVGMSAARQAVLLRERVDAIDAQIAALQNVREYIVQKVGWLEADATDPAPKPAIPASSPAHNSRRRTSASALNP